MNKRNIVIELTYDKFLELIKEAKAKMKLWDSLFQYNLVGIVETLEAAGFYTQDFLWVAMESNSIYKMWGDGDAFWDAISLNEDNAERIAREYWPGFEFK